MLPQMWTTALTTSMYECRYLSEIRLRRKFFPMTAHRHLPLSRQLLALFLDTLV